MDFNLKLTPLHSPRDFIKYLEKNGCEVLYEIMVEWCPLKTDLLWLLRMVECSFILKS